MRIYYSLDDFSPVKNAGVTSGTFDGVHVGHKKILTRLSEVARKNAGETVVITFWPHPRLVLYPNDTELKLLNTFEEKAALLKKEGVQHLLRIPFTKEFFAFLFDRWEDFEEFIEKVRIQSSFSSSILSSNDLAFFARELKGLNKIVTVQGDVKGTIDRLRGRNMIINYGAKCVMAGNIAMSGLPDIEQTYIEADLKKLVLNQKEIETIPQYPFYENEKIEIPQWLAKAGDLKIKGHFTGYIYDFVTYGNIETALGNLSADVNLKLDTDNEKYSRTG